MTPRQMPLIASASLALMTRMFAWSSRFLKSAILPVAAGGQAAAETVTGFQLDRRGRLLRKA